MSAVMPDRADRVDHVTAREAVSEGEFGVAGRTAAQGAAFGQKLRAGGPVDRAVHAATAQKRLIGGVDNGIQAERGDVGDDDVQRRRTDLSLEDQADAWASITPFSASRLCNSPAWNISRTMSQPPMNSPFT